MSKVTNDDLPAEEADVTAEHLADAEYGAKAFLPSMALALAVLNDALPKSLLAAVAKGEHVAVLIETPGDSWVSPIIRALDCMHENGVEYVKPEKNLRFLDDRERIIRVVDRPLFAVTSDPGLLPKELIVGADVRIALRMTPRALRKALRNIYGRSAKVLPADIAGLDWRDLVLAIREDGGPKDAVDRMRSAVIRLGSAFADDQTPRLQDLAGLGDAGPKLLGVVASIEAVRDGRLDAALPSLLLFGEPGTGKTTIARSLARTVGLPLVASSVGDWFSGANAHLGIVISEIRKVFDRALASAPCVLFLDELDALPNRATMDDKGRDWWTPVVTTVLVAIDRMRARDSRVVLVGATNHRDKLDAALIRPGRFDIHLKIVAPKSRADFKKILGHHLKGDLAGVDLGVIADAAVAEEATPATVETWVAGARDVAHSEGRELELGDLVREALPPSKLSPEAEWQTALHEAAHAVVARILGVAVPSVSMAEIGRVLGRATFDWAHAVTRAEIERHVTAGLAGRAADELLCGGATANAQGDLVTATRLMTSVHCSWGLDERLVSFGRSDDSTIGTVAIDRDVRDRIDADLQRLLKDARRLVGEHVSAIQAFATTLMVRRVAVQADIDEAIAQAAQAGDVRPGGLS